MRSLTAQVELDNSAAAPEPIELWSTEEPAKCRFSSGRFDTAHHYDDILKVRLQTDPRWPDQTTPTDTYSDHYCTYVEDQPVGCLSVTRALDGNIFLQEFCPPRLLEAFGDTLVSAYRFRIIDKYRISSPRVPGISLSKMMVREAWREQMAKGASLDVINIEMTHVPFYRRMGYLDCPDSYYEDPVLGTPSCVMFFPVDPGRKSIIQDIIKPTDIHTTVEDVLNCLSQRKIYSVR